VVFDLGARLAFRNDQRRDNAASQIETYVAQFSGDLYVPEQVGAYDGTYKNWPHALSVFLRFMTLSARDDLWAQLDQRLGAGINGPVAGATAWRADADELDEMLLSNRENRGW
jgi:hypothetical protein